MSAAAGFTRSWKCGVYVCTLTVQRPVAGEAAACSIEWEPSLPARLSERELREYRAGRNRALAEIGSELGLALGVLEV